MKIIIKFFTSIFLILFGLGALGKILLLADLNSDLAVLAALVLTCLLAILEYAAFLYLFKTKKEKQ